MKKLSRFSLLAILFALFAFGMIGCGGGGITPTPTPSPTPEASTDVFASLRAEATAGPGAASMTRQELQAARRAAKIAENRQATTVDLSPANIYIWPQHLDSEGFWIVDPERKITDSPSAYTSVHLSLNRTSIVFAKTVNGYNQIFTSTVPAGNETLGHPLQLTSDAEQHWTPHISPDGSRAVFTKPDPNSSGGLVCLLNNAAGATEDCLDFSGTTPVLKGASVRHASWTPDGKKIVFEGWGGPSDSDEIFMVNADGSALTQLTSNAGSKNYDESPSVSVDGARVMVDTWNDATQQYELTNIDVKTKLRDKVALGGLKYDRNTDAQDPLQTRYTFVWVTQQPADQSVELYWEVGFAGAVAVTNNTYSDFFDSSSR